MSNRDRSERHIEKWKLMQQSSRDSEYDVVGPITRIVDNCQAGNVLLKSAIAKAICH